ncbi:MAG: dipeptide epimerase [Flavobacterium sp.]|nr:MAG: dipeptide epimerase [Flavobacterium sp.]
MLLDFKIFELPLKHPFTISRYTVTVQKTMIARISDGEISGYGEATVNPYYHSTVERLSASIAKVKPFVESVSGNPHPSEFWKSIEPHLKDDYFALCAIDIAYWDYFSRKAQKPLKSYFMGAGTPLTSYTIGIDTIQVMKEKILEMPWPVYKIKLGRGHDMETVETLRKITDSVFRIDANCAWTADEAIANAKILKNLNVEFIEQPLAAEDIEGMKKVKAHSVLPVIADESCQRPEDVPACKDLFHGINIKLMKCGGITPALRMIGEAREDNLLVMAGCMTESTIGISALVQIAPLLDFLDADGALLLSGDIADGVAFNQGKIVYGEGFGTGAKIHSF